MEAMHTSGRRLASARRAKPFALFDSLLAAGHLLCCVGLAFILSNPADAQTTTGTGTVTGRVLSAISGQYLEGAEVSVEGSSLHTTAGRDGTFVLNDVPAGNAVIVATYPGVETKSQSVEVSPGNIALVNVTLGQEVIQLERLVVRGAKEGMVQAVALQKVAIQSKLVAAADQFGPVSEGNIGEYLKFLPGVSIDYNVNDARGISLRGLSTAFTIVGVDGTPMAGGSSVDDTRRFEFEQIAMNNVETTELFKTVTPDIPATSTGGFVNFITKSAFDHEDLQRFSYDVSLSVPSTNVGFGKEGGVWGHHTHWLVRPSAELNFSRKINAKLGVNLNYRLSEKYDDSPRTEFAYVNANDIFTGARINNYNIRSEEKLTHRQAFATKVDYKLGDATALMFSAQWNWYDLNFTQRGPSFVLNTNATRNSDGAFFTSASNGSITDGTLYRNKYGTTLHFNGNLTHTFGDGSVLSFTPYYSRADGNYRDTAKGFVSATATLALGATAPVQSFRLIQPMTLGRLPTIELYQGSTPVAMDVVRDLANYTLTGTATGTAIQSRPWTAIDLKDGARVDYTARGFEHAAVPVTLMVGAASDKTKRTINRPDYRYTLAATTGASLDALKDPLYTRDVALGFGSYEAPDPYLVYDLVKGTIPTLNLVDSRRFDEQNDAAYIRFDARLQPEFVLIGGLRYEKREVSAFGRTGSPVRARDSTAHVDFSSTYPSLSFKYTPRRNVVIRGGYSRTIGIPDYGDMLPTFTAASTSTASDGTISVPASNLQPFATNNYDLNFEYYMKNAGLITVNLYRKDVSDFIISRSMTATELSAIYAQYGLNAADFGTTASGTIRENGPKTSLQGIEVSYSQNLAFLPKPFNGLSVQANATYMDIDASDSDPLRANDALLAQNRGVSPKTANFVLGYRQGRVNVTSTTNWVSESVFGGFVNTGFVQGTGDNRLVLVRGQKATTDIKVEYAFSKQVSAYLLVRNVFNSPRKDYARGYLPQYRDIKLPWRYYEFGEPHLTFGLRGMF
ncbi:MAG TPA: TonB-dependent receptor [Lacunisphaera sp.]|nr:TonB-dependent receptor [Lacunisphaera sp.]